MTTVPIYTGDAPDRDQDQTTFDTNVQDFVDFISGTETTDLIPRFNTVAGEVNTNATNAANSEAAAESARDIAVSASGATLYAAGTTYNEGDYAIDDLTHDPYICTTDGTIGVQPSTDTTGKWRLVSYGNTAVNLFINPEFEVNQEGYSSGVITTGSYGHDMIKSISSLSYTVTANAWTIVSGTAGIRNDDLVAEDGNRLYVSVESGSLTLGATAGAAAVTVTPTTPYNFVYDASGSAFITFTAAASAKGIRIATSPGKYVKPEPRAEEARCYWYFYKGLGGVCDVVFYQDYKFHGTFQTPYAMKSSATATITLADFTVGPYSSEVAYAGYPYSPNSLTIDRSQASFSTKDIMWQVVGSVDSGYAAVTTGIVGNLDASVGALELDARY